MPQDKLQALYDFDEADLASNRLNQLTEKQKTTLAEMAKKHKSFNTTIGIFIAVMFGGSLLTGLAVPILAAIGGSFLEDGAITPQVVIGILPVLCMGLFFLVVFGGILIVVLRLIFERANKKADIVVRRAEGTVNFVWVEKQERRRSGSSYVYRTVRVLEMRIGGETFTVKEELPSIINQGEEWIFYYVNHPFKFLSAEKIR